MAHRCLHLPPSSSSSDHDKKKLVMQPNNPGGKNDQTSEDGHSSYSRMMMMMMEDNNPNNNGRNYYYNCYSPSELWGGNPFERMLPFNSNSHEEQPPTKSHGNGILSATNVEQVVAVDNVGGNVKMSGEGGVTTTTTTSSSGGSMSLNNDDSKGCDFKGLKDECQSEGQEVSGDNCKKTSSGSRSSKRSRAAEVHNLSEKRRRNRINEKMKALQNLIPNSNKTDKASMLDEAIDYLKKLQLQVQMLSARSGIDISSMRWLSQIPHLQIQQPQQAIPNAFLSRSHTTLSSNEAAGIVATSQADEWRPSMSSQPRENQYNDVGLSDNSISGWPPVRKPNESEWTPASSSSCKIGTHQDCFILPRVEADGTQGLHSALSLRDKKI